RAREQLVMSYARTRRVWGEIRVQGPSRFIEDLPRDVLAQPVRRVVLPSGPRIVEGNFIPKRTARASGNEFDQRALDDDVPVFNVDADLEPEPFRTGDAVSHALHGNGRVIAVSGTGKDCKVIVDFATVGRKTVFAKYLTSDQVN